jgi:hypothetical protein
VVLIQRKKWFLKISEIYFATLADQEQLPGDLLILNQAIDKIDGALPFRTLHLDLSQPSQALFEKIDKQVRYEIRRAEKNDSFFISILNCPDKKDIISFAYFYNRFARSKGLSDCRLAHLLILAENNIIVLSQACDISGQMLVAHAYIVDGTRARLLLSASLFRNSEVSAARALYGRANRVLHWRDIEFFKESHYKTYDFGGIADLAQKPELAGINEFKIAFGGVQVIEYNLVKARTVLGKIAIKVQRCISS